MPKDKDKEWDLPTFNKCCVFVYSHKDPKMNKIHLRTRAELQGEKKKLLKALDRRIEPPWAVTVKYMDTLSGHFLYETVICHVESGIAPCHMKHGLNAFNKQYIILKSGHTDYDSFNPSLAAFDDLKSIYTGFWMKGQLPHRTFEDYIPQIDGPYPDSMFLRVKEKRQIRPQTSKQIAELKVKCKM
jgi:hypothetical protein